MIQNKRLIVFNGLSANHFIRLGQAKVFQAIGYKLYFYDQESKESIIDVFNKFKPTTIMLGSYQIDRPLMKALKACENIEIILWCPNWDNKIYFENNDIQEIDTVNDGVLIANEQEKRWVEELVKLHNIKYCFVAYTQKWANRTNGGWREIGLEPIGIPLAADLYDYALGEYDEKLKSDIAWVGGWWDYKAVNMKKYLLPLCNQDLNVKLFGYGNYPVAQHLGPIDTQHVKNLYYSAKICPSVFEPLVKYGFDVSERIYKILSSGGFCISQYCESLEEIFINDEIVVSCDQEEFFEQVRNFLDNPEETMRYRLRGIEYAYSNGNYFSRIRDIMSYLGKIDDTINLNNIIKQNSNIIPDMQSRIKNDQTSNLFKR